jgi:ATP synthase protein I
VRENNQLRERLDKQARRFKKAEDERRSLLAQTVYLGTLGLVFVLPVIAGAYLGNWLDSLVAGYSIRWTMSLILLGVFIGAVNVYLFIRE